MPYSGMNDKDLPAAVKKMSDEMRKQWVEVFNQCIKDGDDEKTAFKKAYGAVKQKGYVESWDVWDRQVSSHMVNYNSLGATSTKGCAACNWFVSPDSCLLVYGDIAPTGLCDKFMKPEEHEMKPMPVTIVEAEKEIPDTIIDRIVERIKNIFFQGPPAPREGPVHVVFSCIKQVDGRTRFFTVFSNYYKDKQGEILSSAAHKEYVDWVTSTGAYPDLQLWHCGNKSKWGKVDWVEYVDGLVCASGLIDAGKEEIAERITKEDLGVSHGFIGLVNKEKIVTKYRTFEISPLPKWAAANLWTGINFVNEGVEMPFTEQKRNWLKSVAGLSDDVINGMEKDVDGLASNLKTLGLEFKEGEENLAQTVATLTKTIADLSAIVVTQKSSIEKLEQGLDAKVEEVFKAEVAKLPQGYKASESSDNIVDKKESSQDISWFEETVLKGVL